MTRLALFIPGHAVSVNSMYVRRRYGGVALSTAAREWKKAVCDFVSFEAMTSGFPRRADLPEDARVAVSYRCVGVRGDADNYSKLCLDGIAAALGINDKHFVIAGAEVERPKQTKANATAGAARQVVGVYLTLEIMTVTVAPLTTGGAG